ncbi:MAG: hypothetical protein GXP13_09995 [Gammaproteobacteria bacterium]|nr:hypothetical protein [Gammaproteobacteria bacterium]
MGTWFQIASAALLAFILWRLWPAANHWMKNGPRGTKKDWQGAIIPLLAVVGFVILLIMMVKK